jgi:uncharacterized repeat protein (TIGR03803 family)
MEIPEEVFFEVAPMKKPCVLQMTCVVFVFCAATAIASPAQVFTTLYSFGDRSHNNGSGVLPVAALVQAKDGNFYGTTSEGGSGYVGTVFKVTPAGALTTLHNFVGRDGSIPYASLVQASDGNFYGTTVNGGTSGSCPPDGCGTVFKITPTGALTTLYSFCSQPNCTDGYPPSGLVQATDGNFYGTTGYSGANDTCSDGCGTVFRITPSGALTTLYNFCSQPNCTDGYTPSSGLVQASDGNFYGETGGTVYKITPTGTLTNLHTFNGTDGSNAGGGLVQGADGNFYGTTTYGGANDSGTVFQMTPEGSLTTLYSFCNDQFCEDGGRPSAGLVQASDGNFYGTTVYGGFPGYGTVFKVTSSGALDTLHAFQGPDGKWPYAGLVQGTDGNLYGTTWRGGAYGVGTVFRLVLPRTCIVCPTVE